MREQKGESVRRPSHSFTLVLSYHNPNEEGSAVRRTLLLSSLNVPIYLWEGSSLVVSL